MNRGLALVLVLVLVSDIILCVPSRSSRFAVYHVPLLFRGLRWEHPARGRPISDIG